MAFFFFFFWSRGGMVLEVIRTCSSQLCVRPMLCTGIYLYFNLILDMYILLISFRMYFIILNFVLLLLCNSPVYRV